MKQEALLTDVPVSRRTDPSSSYRAEEEINRDGTRAKQQIEVLELIKRFPGYTTLELSRHSLLDRYQIARRAPELEGVGLVKRVKNARLCLISRKLACTWYPVGDR